MKEVNKVNWVSWLMHNYRLTFPLFGQRTLSLPQCLELAVSHTRTLRSAALEVESADAARREAFTNYFSEVSASVLAFHTFDKLVKGDGVFPEEIAVFGEQYAAMVGQPFSLREMNKGYTATVSVVQPLFRLSRLPNQTGRLSAEDREVRKISPVTLKRCCAHPYVDARKHKLPRRITSSFGASGWAIKRIRRRQAASAMAYTGCSTAVSSGCTKVQSVVPDMQQSATSSGMR